MLDNILGSFFFELLGALVRWIFLALIYSIRGKELIKFQDIWNDKSKTDPMNPIFNSFSNTIIGFLLVMTIFIIILIT